MICISQASEEMELTSEQKQKLLAICADEHPTHEQVRQILEESDMSDEEFLAILRGRSERLNTIKNAHDFA